MGPTEDNCSRAMGNVGCCQSENIEDVPDETRHRMDAFHDEQVPNVLDGSSNWTKSSPDARTLELSRNAQVEGPATPPPEIEAAARPLRIMVVSAIGMRNADWQGSGESRPFCMCM